MSLVLDSGGVRRLAKRSRDSVALIGAFRDEGLWPVVVPSAVLIECLTGDGSRDAAANRLLKTCDVVEELPDELARRAARLRTKARRGSAVDALVVATADPMGTVVTGDAKDLRALARHARHVTIHVI
ncbi:MAG TPA: PIN domain-containing protein [Mycobacteriales bacterium]|nr:PIN domain-containing protein [Mycobacteriales bacterium]